MRDVPAACARCVIDGADGNPFYMEELVKMLIDDGVIAVEADGWRVQPDRLLAAHVPPTLTGVLQARLDALPRPSARRCSRRPWSATCSGTSALAAIDAGAAAGCCPLLQKALVVPRDGRRPSTTAANTRSGTTCCTR